MNALHTKILQPAFYVNAMSVIAGELLIIAGGELDISHAGVFPLLLARVICNITECKSIS